MHVVPVADYDLEWHEANIEYGDGDDLKAFETVKRGLAKLTPAQRKASRWPTRKELEATLRALGDKPGYQIWFGPKIGPWQYGRVTNKKTEDVTVNLGAKGTYYCEAHASMLREFAEAIAKVAGPQVTFLGEDYSPADFTALYVAAPAPTKTTTKPTSKTKTKSKAKPKVKTTPKPRGKP